MHFSAKTPTFPSLCTISAVDKACQRDIRQRNKPSQKRNLTRTHCRQLLFTKAVTLGGALALGAPSRATSKVQHCKHMQYTVLAMVRFHACFQQFLIIPHQMRTVLDALAKLLRISDGHHTQCLRRVLDALVKLLQILDGYHTRCLQRVLDALAS